MKSILLLLTLTSAAFAERYEYDVQGRLTAVTYDDDRRIQYTYDNASNLTKVEADVAPPDKGCCSTGGSPASSVLGLGVLAGLLRRRKR